MNKFIKTSLVIAVFTLFSFLVGFLCSKIVFIEQLAWKIIDTESKLLKTEELHSRLTLICVDDRTLESLGEFPLPRKVYAYLLSGFQHNLPQAIGFDMLFIEPTPDDDEFSYYAEVLGNVVVGNYHEPKYGTISPIAEIDKVTKSGLLNVIQDSDGVIRRVPLIVTIQGSDYPSFALQILLEMYDLEFDHVVRDDGSLLIDLENKDIKIPVDDEGYMMINYPVEFDDYNKYSLVDVLHWIKTQDKKVNSVVGDIVIIGTSYTGGPDLGVTPFGNNQPLMTVHAAVLNTIFQRSFIREVPESINALIAVFFLLLFVVGCYKLKPLYSVGSFLVVCISMFLLQGYLFYNRMIFLLPFPFICIVFAFFSVNVFKHIWTDKERRLIKSAFNKYLSGDLIEQILADPSQLKLGGEKKHITVMFLDICGFTGLCENISPKDIVDILNSAFDWITEIILRNKGLLDKYIGDAIMSIFGAPIQMQKNVQSEMAVKCALEIIERWNDWADARKVEIDIGIGINTGEALVGNMGSRYIFDYTAVGDTVNTASRLEKLTRKYDSKLIIASDVYEMLADVYKKQFVYLDDIQIKGRQKTVKIWALK